MTFIACGLLAAVLVSTSQVQDPAGTPAETARLPIKRIALYKSGVGYFEHLGRVRDREDVTVSFTSGQLNDVLKSLTVLDLNGGRIAAVSYGSKAPLDRQLGDLQLPAGDKTTLTDFLGAVRGARVEIRSGAAAPITGRLVSVERKTRISGTTTLEVDYISLLTDSGELRTTEVSPSFSVRLLERGLAGKVGRFLDLVSSVREPDQRQMVIAAEGSGERSLFVSYISEVPVWKATYRIVLGSKPGQNPLLQGWAIVDNTVGQDWEDVQLSLVSGAPQSFVQNLSQPLYTRRPVVPVAETAALSPQTFEATLIPGGGAVQGVVRDASGTGIPGAHVGAFNADNVLAGEAVTNPSGEYRLSSLPEGVVKLRFDAPGFNRTEITGVAISAANTARHDVVLQVGSVSETVTVSAEAAELQTNTASVSGGARTLGSGRALGRGLGRGDRQSGGSRAGVAALPLLAAARAQAEAAAAAQDLGDFFEYKLKEPITIRRNRSALVPIVHTPITAEKVSLWNPQNSSMHPVRTLSIENSTGLTLDGGSFTVLEEETFAGEGIFESIRPGEKRFVSYATDLALNVSSRQASEPQRVSRVRINRGVMTQEFEIHESKTYTIRNEDTLARTVIVEHPLRSGYDLRGAARPIESTPSWHRFRIQVEPKQTASLVVEEVRPQASTYALTSVDSPRLELFVRNHAIDGAIEDALRKILVQKAALQELGVQKSTRETETENIFEDQQRVRENMKALKGSAEEKALIQRYTQQLNQQETRLEALAKEIRELESRIEAAEAALDRAIQDLSFDVKL